MLSATATDITGSSAGSLKWARSYICIYIYRYIDLFGLDNLYLVINWILNPQLKLTNKMSGWPRYMILGRHTNNHCHYIPIALECPNPAQPSRARSRRQRSALLPCTRRSQSFTAPSWCDTTGDVWHGVKPSETLKQLCYSQKCSRFFSSPLQLQLHLLNVGSASSSSTTPTAIHYRWFSRSPSRAFPTWEHHLDYSGHLQPLLGRK